MEVVPGSCAQGHNSTIQAVSNSNSTEPHDQPQESVGRSPKDQTNLDVTTMKPQPSRVANLEYLERLSPHDVPRTARVRLPHRAEGNVVAAKTRLSARELAVRVRVRAARRDH